MTISSARSCALFSYPFKVLATTALGSTLIASPAFAAGTGAGTKIDNTATATYSLAGGGTGSVQSNTVSLTVDELLDVTVVWADGGDVTVTPGSTNQVLTYTVTNTGNGSEAFGLSVQNSSSDGFDPSAYTIYLDSDGSGDYTPGVDQAYSPGVNDPVLAADASVTVFVVSTIPAGLADGLRAQVDLIAAAKTGTGTPGSVFPNAGTGGGDAVVGTSGADGRDDGYYLTSAATVSFVKSATVVDPFGGATVVPGSVVTYTLAATVNGTGTLNNIAIADPVPAGTTYRPGTLTLEGAPLTDPAGDDAGEVTGGGVAVRLGNVAAGATRTVTFKVTVNN